MSDLSKEDLREIHRRVIRGEMTNWDAYRAKREQAHDEERDWYRYNDAGPSNTVIIAAVALGISMLILAASLTLQSL